MRPVVHDGLEQPWSPWCGALAADD